MNKGLFSVDNPAENRPLNISFLKCHNFIFAPKNKTNSRTKKIDSFSLVDRG